MGYVKFEDDKGEPIQYYDNIGNITPKEIWEGKDEWFGKVNRSKQEWEKLSDEYREALERLVKSALERMHDRVEEWLPEALEVSGGNFIDVHIKLLFTDIDKEIDRNEQATSFQVKEAAKEAQEAVALFKKES